MDAISFRKMPLHEFESIYSEETYLNRGQYGCVYKYKDSRTNKYVAIKELMRTYNLSTFHKEIDIMMTVNHPNVLSCSDYFYRESHRKHCLVLEYCSRGSLKDNFLEVFEWPDIRKVEICYQIAMGINALHEKDVMHRDIKPGNILFDENFQIKVCDFGFCRTDTDVEKSVEVGSPLYRDPNVESKKYTKKCDIYSTGITFDTIFRKTCIFESDNKISFNEELKTFHEESKLKKINALTCDQEIKEIIICCLEKEEINRISSDKLVERLANLLTRLKNGTVSNKQKQSEVELQESETPALDARCSFKKKEKINDSVEKISTQDGSYSKGSKEKELIEEFREEKTERKRESPDSLAEKLGKSLENTDKVLFANIENKKTETVKEILNVEVEKESDPIYFSEGSNIRKETKYEKPISCNFRNLSLKTCIVLEENKQKTQNFIKIYAYFELRRSKIREFKNLSLLASIPPLYLKVAVFIALYAYLRFLHIHSDFMSGKSCSKIYKIENVSYEGLNIETREKFVSMINKEKEMIFGKITNCMHEVYDRKNELKDNRSYQEKYTLTDKLIYMLNDGIEKCFMNIGELSGREIEKEFENVLLHSSFKVYIKEEEKKKMELCQILQLF